MMFSFLKATSEVALKEKNSSSILYKLQINVVLFDALSKPKHHWILTKGLQFSRQRFGLSLLRCSKA